MKVNTLLIISLLAASTLEAVSLDGTTGTSIYQSSSYPFANGDFARGFVWLNGGFTIPAGGIVNMNVIRVSGPINMNDTGQITLEGDLPLMSDVTLAAGAVIDGQGKSIKLDGNLTIPAGAVLQAVSDTIIDGQGHDLVFQDGVPGGILAVNGPSGTTLTLRNLTLKGVKTYSNFDSSIAFGSNPNQTLILDNVTLHLSDNFIFFGGGLTIINTVKITGVFPPSMRDTLQPTLFINASMNDCVIRADSTLLIDTTTWWVYLPLDQSNKRFILQSPSSQLYLNGCTLFVPNNIGLKLTKGHIIIDHKTTIRSNGIGGKPTKFGAGPGKPNKDVVLDLLPGAQLIATDARVIYQNQQ